MQVRLLNKDPLYDYREACKVTQGIVLNREDLKKPENEVEWWIKQIVANHSTIRCIRFRIFDMRPKSVVMQLIRATKGHPQPYVQSSRPDWTGKERSSNPYELKMYIQDHTAESFIEMAKQRLCLRTETNTRKAVTEIVDMLRHSDEPFLKAVGWCAQPTCMWLGGTCPEIKGCGLNTLKMSQSVIDFMNKMTGGKENE